MKKYFFKRLLDNANDLIWAIDMEGRFTYINDNIKAWGYKKEELIGKPLLNILNTKHIGKRQSNPVKLGIERTFEMELLDKLGNVHNVVVSSSPLPDNDGNIIGVMGIIRDVTEMQRLEEKLKVEERLASLGRLSMGIAHEIRNPLSSVKMNLAILRKRLSPSGDDLEHFTIAQNEVTNLERVMNELLDYARPSPLNFNYEDPHEVIEETLAVARTESTAKNVTIIKHFADSVPLIQIDRGKVHQALLNIFLNAIQASHHGGDIEIKTQITDEPVKSLTIVTIDHGDGIKPENLKFVFDPFYTTKRSGTGLGLSIVRNIVKNHSGDIAIESEPGKGTSVYMEFPAE
ncbi:MAG: nitrogen regulation protein NR(II) [Nitrospinota bacterium]